MHLLRKTSRHQVHTNAESFVIWLTQLQLWKNPCQAGQRSKYEEFESTDAVVTGRQRTRMQLRNNAGTKLGKERPAICFGLNPKGTL